MPRVKRANLKKGGKKQPTEEVVKARKPTFYFPFPVTKRSVEKHRLPSGIEATAQSKCVRQVVREVAGFAPYEKRIMELIRVGSASSVKKAMKFAKKRLGATVRGRAKRDELTLVVQEQRKRQQH